MYLALNVRSNGNDLGLASCQSNATGKGGYGTVAGQNHLRFNAEWALAQTLYRDTLVVDNSASCPGPTKKASALCNGVF
jgi:hypothetical protein